MEDIIKQKGCQIFRATGCEFRIAGCALRILRLRIWDLRFRIGKIEWIVTNTIRKAGPLLYI